ncbi:MAG: helix-turn-helix domain-containing protein [Planctomycetes bacterium]|nr:helix-turn-helix domain-containing protein [Planctomycetota bacterium]
MDCILPKHVRARIINLLESGSCLLNIKLCYREYSNGYNLPEKWGLHIVEACIEKKKDHLGTCCHHDGYETDRALAGMPEGRIQTCPHGFTEIAVPVIIDGRSCGTLFGGPCWLRKSPPPHATLIVPPSRNWLKERLPLMQAIAGEIGRLITGDQIHRPQKRHAEIMSYINDSLERQVEIGELAKRLNLSRSRTSHLVKELFGTSLPLLARKAKLQEAARELTSTDLTVGEISKRYGFYDQNYFSRIFSSEFGIPPRQYRNNYPLDV